MPTTSEAWVVEPMKKPEWESVVVPVLPITMPGLLPVSDVRLRRTVDRRLLHRVLDLGGLGRGEHDVGLELRLASGPATGCCQYLTRWAWW